MTATREVGYHALMSLIDLDFLLRRGRRELAEFGLLLLGPGGKDGAHAEALAEQRAKAMDLWLRAKDLRREAKGAIAEATSLLTDAEEVERAAMAAELAVLALEADRARAGKEGQ